ncbi:Origin recognition complex subunit 4 [Paramyrothecium foliicola]|nr:Origin recognition complex subunit 4 [Paramyrothecium foliicola]
MENHATPAGLKRPLSPSDATTPESHKKRKTNGLEPDSTSTTTKPVASTVAASIADAPVNGIQAQSQNDDTIHVNGSAAQPALPQPPAPAPKARPAIKLAALRGTKWDTGVPKPAKVPKRPAPRSSTPKKRASTSVASKRAAATNGVHEQTSEDQASGTSVTNGRGDSADELASSFALSNGQSPAQLSPVKSALGSVRAIAPPKGILTPTKKRGRPPKSVTFSGKAQKEVFFEDLPKVPSTKKRKGAPKPAGTEDEIGPDDIVCAICSRPDSKAPNQIILCDNCDFAVHQSCYEVSEIPEGEWLCKSCAQEDILKTPKKLEDITATADVPAAEIPDIPNLDQHLRSLQRVLVDRCSGRRRIRIFGQEEAHEKARQVVEQTIVAGEGNSMLLIGARGSGKTTLVENIISDLSREHKTDFHVVRLNGFIHTDDKLALREIWRQLGKEMEVDDDLVSRTNYADTMASLLALLSHPSEILGMDEGVTSQSVVFIIDEFDMFASHPRQTLLYNLFDIAQSRKAPIAVLGCTTRLDVVEMLEKRVKSRFSHRYVYLSLPKSLPAFWQVCRQGLLVERSDLKKEGIDISLEGYDAFHRYWAHKIEDLYKKRPFQDLLQYHYYTTKSASAFFTEWMLPLASLSPTNLALHIPTVGAETTSLAAPDSRLQLLASLSELDVGLLIAATRLDIIAHTDTVNFAMAYDEYSSLVGKQRVQTSTSGMLAVGGAARVWSRGVAGLAWERLISLGLLVPSGLGGSRALGHEGLDGKMWKVDVALEEIPTAVKLNAVLARWCREI